MYSGGHLPPSFSKVGVSEEEEEEGRSAGAERVVVNKELPNVLITNDDGIEAPGLQALVAALVQGSRCNVYICAPDSEKSAVGHSITARGSIEVASVSISGATAFKASGTPADCVSLALTGSIFAWTKPTMVISGINKGSNCGYHVFYSGTVAGAREAFMSGVPAISISLDWKKGESSVEDFQSAAIVSLPLIYAALRDIKKGIYPQKCFLNVDIPTKPSEHKGYKVTRQGTSRLPLRWKHVTHQSAQEKRMQMLKEQGIGLQMAQLGLAASAAGAARRANKKYTDVESVGAAGSAARETSQIMQFRLEGTEFEVGEKAEDLDFGALEQGFVSVTALGLATNPEVHTQSQAAEWVASAVEVIPPSAL